MTRRVLIRLIACLAVSLPCPAQDQTSLHKSIDDAVTTTLRDTGIPSASIAVRTGETLYAKAYGNARLNPNVPAQPDMRYKIASNSKQIAATAILLLAEQHKISLDDPVARFLPGLTRAREVTIRQLLSHTSGYQDYYPLDYVAPFMARPVTATQILDQWAKKPLDFEPGTRWQYSNTNYVIVGQIIEKITGKPLIDFLRTRIFQPLGMLSVIDITQQSWDATNPEGYAQFALGPPHPSPPEGNGWMFAAGELAMTASDLATWDESLIKGSILKPESMRALTTEILLKNGTGTNYALGLEVSETASGNRRWSHSGGASGFVSRNTTFPDDHASITVLTNGEGSAANLIARKIENLVFPPSADPTAAAALTNARKLFTGLQNGELDKSLITANLADYFSPAALADFTASLKPLGAITAFTAGPREDRGGMVARGFNVRTAQRSLRISTFVTPDGKFDQFLITPAP